MSSESVNVSEEEVPLESVFKNVLSESSEEPPMENWSSLIGYIPPDNPKMALFKQGLYKPGSEEVCAMYIPMSDSDVLRHVYYNYPCVLDPGIEDALLKREPIKIYSYDGQELYLEMCEEMKLAPVMMFYRGLLKERIDLKYYGFNPRGVRAMTGALTKNSTVTHLDLSGNELNDDACYHLGLLLGENILIRELLLSGCKIKASGAQRLCVYLYSHEMDILDLSMNELRDEGLKYLAEQISKGAIIKRLSLSKNILSSNSAIALAEAIETFNTITHLDLSWNSMISPKATDNLFEQLSQRHVLVELNVSWNSLTTTLAFKKLLSIKSLKILDFSNNRLTTDAVKPITQALKSAKKLQTLDLSHNLFTAKDALKFIKTLRLKKVKLKCLMMDDLAVAKEFYNELKELKKEKDTVVTYGKVLSNYTIPLPDIREIVLKRILYLTTSGKKKSRIDIALYFLQKCKENQYILPRDILYELKHRSVHVDEDLLDEISNSFPGPRVNKNVRAIDLQALADYMQRLWPDKKLPPSPPLELELKSKEKSKPDPKQKSGTTKKKNK